MEITLKMIYEKLEEIDSYINNAEKEEKHESDNVSKINKALSKAQSEYPPIYLNRTSNYLNRQYADIDNIMSGIREILGRNELSVTQDTVLLETGATNLRTRIRHSSGQWIQSIERIRSNETDDDAYNSALNETRKNQLMLLLNVTVYSDSSDDNGYESMKTTYAENGEPVNEHHAYKHKKGNCQVITRAELKEIKTELAFIPGVEPKLLRDLHLRSFADLPKSDFKVVLKTIRANKDAYQNSKK